MTGIDFRILDFVQAHVRCGLLDAIVPGITALGEFGAIWLLLAAVLLLRKDTRKLGVMVAISLALDVLLCNVLLKNIVARPRPFTLRPGISLLISPPAGYSFPSGHSAASFAAAGALWFGKSRWRVPALILAAFIAASRVYLYVHYPSDVVCGTLLGLLCGFLGCFFARKWFELCKNRKN